jgi:uncharacterized protein (DUF305 family)
MNTTITRRTCLALLLTAALSFGPLATIASAPAPTKKQARYEVDFLTGMIDHHAMAVMMSDLCMGRAVHPELEQLCEQIKAAQTQEIQEMQSWLEDWYGISYEPQMKQGGQKKMDRLASMTGAEFEIEFMEVMIKHHEKAVKAGSQCVKKAYHPELIQMCENIVQTQTEEIMMMEEWLCDWYQICK